MVIKNKIGFFEMYKNVREAYNEVIFEEHYIEEIYDKYEYLVLDVADSKMRIKGFNKDYKTIMDYVVESCNFLAPYAILKRVNEEYYNQHVNDEVSEELTKPLGVIESIEVENFDKDTLKLETSEKSEANVSFDPYKYSCVSLYTLPLDLAKEIEIDKRQEKRNKGNKNKFSNNKFQNNQSGKVFSNSYSNYSNKN